MNKALVAAIASLSKEDALEFRRRLRNNENREEIVEEIVDKHRWRKTYGKMLESRQEI